MDVAFSRKENNADKNSIHSIIQPVKLYSLLIFFFFHRSFFFNITVNIEAYYSYKHTYCGYQESYIHVKVDL